MTSEAPRAALVTGGARRIGRAISLALARSGYDVAIHCHRACEAAEQLVQDIEALGRRAVWRSEDLAEPEAPVRLAAWAEASLGPLGLLVNNASIYAATPVEALDAASWDRCMAINARAPVLLGADLGARMRARGAGAIVNLLDAGLGVARRHHLAYQASKRALEAATLTLARALAPEVRVNGVAPGVVLPPEDPAQDPPLDELLLRVPMGRLGSPEEVAAAVLFLADGPAYVTGVILPVDGGRRLA